MELALQPLILLLQLFKAHRLFAEDLWRSIFVGIEVRGTLRRGLAGRWRSAFWTRWIGRIGDGGGLVSQSQRIPWFLGLVLSIFNILGSRIRFFGLDGFAGWISASGCSCNCPSSAGLSRDSSPSASPFRPPPEMPVSQEQQPCSTPCRSSWEWLVDISRK